MKEYYAILKQCSDKELLDLWEWYTGNNVDDAINSVSCDVVIPIWDVIEERGLDVRESDLRLIRFVLKQWVSVNVPWWDREIVNPPFTHWWWYLDLIAQRQYPAELLPEELRKEYEKCQSIPTSIF